MITVTDHGLPDKLTDFFDEIDKMTEYQQWYFAHYHTEYRFDDRKHTCLFNNVYELKNGYDMVPVNENILAERSEARMSFVKHLIMQSAESKGVKLSEEELEAEVGQRKKVSEDEYKYFYERR